jgi:hypothetical protein
MTADSLLEGTRASAVKVGRSKAEDVEPYGHSWLTLQCFEPWSLRGWGNRPRCSVVSRYKALPGQRLVQRGGLGLFPSLPFSKLRKIVLAIATTRHQVVDFLTLEHDPT